MTYDITETLKDDCVQVIIQKASQGLFYNDSLLSYRYDHITQNGFEIGYYHYADNNGINDAVSQANHFIGQIKGLKSDTVYFLDIENEDQWTKQQAIDFTNTFITYMQSKGYKMGLYTGLSFYYEYLQGSIPIVPLWLASYGKQPEQYPNVSWQSSESGSLPGVIGDIDLDSFSDNIFLNENTSQPTVIKPTVQYYNGYNMDKVKSLQRLLNGLGII